MPKKKQKSKSVAASKVKKPKVVASGRSIFANSALIAGVIMLLFGSVGLSAYLYTTFAAASGTTAFRVAHANIKVTLPAKKFKAELTKVMKAKPDLITLNEAHSRTNRQLAIGGYSTWRTNDTSMLTTKARNDTAVLWKTSKWTVLQRGANIISNSAMKNKAGRETGNGKRVANWVTLQRVGNGGVVTLISAHTIPKPAVHPSRKKIMAASMNSLTALATSKKTITLPNGSRINGAVIVGGDLNYDYRTDRKVRLPNFPYVRSNAIGLRSNFQRLGKPAQGWATSASGLTYDYILSNVRAVNHRLLVGKVSDHNYIVANFSYTFSVTASTTAPKLDLDTQPNANLSAADAAIPKPVANNEPEDGVAVDPSTGFEIETP